MAQRLLKKDVVLKGGGNQTAVDESMFMKIDSSSPQKEEAVVADDDLGDSARVKDEL